MAGIHLTIFIEAPVERVFDLTRSLAVYKHVFNSRKENFTAASATNFLSKNEMVTIVAKHLGKERVLSLKVTALERPLLLVEEAVKGDIEIFRHEHHFKPVQNGTIVIDIIDFGMPRDFVGKYAGRFYMKNYIEDLVRKRNEVIRSFAETEKWRAIM